MIGRVRRAPSPALVISVIALVVAIGGGTFAIASSQSKQEKKIATKVVRKLSPGLSVSHAKTADQSTTAATATRADTAGNAEKLGGAPAGAYESRAQWALVNKEGSILAQSGGITINTTYAANGVYLLNLGRTAANRPIGVVPHYGDGGLVGDASVTVCGGNGVPGGFECTQVPGVNDADHILVRLQSSAGTEAPFGFYVTVGG